jgi:hypothetical protein
MIMPVDLPPLVRLKLLELLAELGIHAGDAPRIAKAVMAMSDFYAKHPEKSSPWSESWAKVAYLAYYMPLNWWRLCGVTARGQQLKFFDGFEHYIDFGSGLGSAGLAFDHHDLTFKSALCVERSTEAIAFHRKLVTESKTVIDWSKDVDGRDVKPKTLAVFSYSFTELERLPPWVDHCDGLMIVEPSTKDDSRRLQALRTELLEKGWHVWGPCTHAKLCPLLTHSERDWCHDRFTWQQPDWLKAIEQHMPIKNGTLPCSWLMMRRDKPRLETTNLARVTGDLQQFKGFAKQLICRGENREFVAWQKKHFKKSYPIIPRGELIALKDHLELKNNEVRASSAEDVCLAETYGSK